MNRHRDVLEVPAEEVAAYFAGNERQDVKIVVPSLLEGLLAEGMRSRGRSAKEEIRLDGSRWSSSLPHELNKACESGEFAAVETPEASGPFTISFANEKSDQEEHFHARHTEIYYSGHAISGHYRRREESTAHSIRLDHGGLLVFGPNVLHRVQLTGITLVIELPAIEDDRIIATAPPH